MLAFTCMVINRYVGIHIIFFLYSCLDFLLTSFHIIIIALHHTDLCGFVSMDTLPFTMLHKKVIQISSAFF